MCSASHIRNICNMTYTADCLYPILTRVFPVIQIIECVRTDDADFEELVEGMGGQVTQPFGIDDMSNFVDLTHFCLDLHPEIDGEMKCLCARGDNSSRDMGEETRRMYTARNHCCWPVMADSCVIGRDRRLMSGVDDILSQTNNLPVGVQVVRDETQQMVMMALTGIEYFHAEKYKCVTF